MISSCELFTSSMTASASPRNRAQRRCCRVVGGLWLWFTHWLDHLSGGLEGRSGRGVRHRPGTCFVVVYFQPYYLPTIQFPEAIVQPG